MGRPRELTDQILIQILVECPNRIAAKITGRHEVTIVSDRTRLRITSPWQRRPGMFSDRMNKFLQWRWAKWREQLPEPVSLERLEQLMAEWHKRMRVPLVPGMPPDEDVLAKLAELAPGTPTEEELASAGGWELEPLRKTVFKLRRAERLRRDPQTGTLHLVQTPEDANVWYPLDEFADKFLNQRPEPPATPTVQIQEVHAEVEVTATAEQQPIQEEQAKAPTWPLEDAELLREAQEIRASGRWVVQTLAKRYNVKQLEVSRTLAEATRRQAPGTNKPVEWPDDEEVAQIVEEVYADSSVSNVEAVLCERFSCSNATLFTHVTRVFKRLDRPKPTRKRGGQAKAEPVVLQAEPQAQSNGGPAPGCTACGDTGRIGGHSESGQVCECRQGKMLLEELLAEPAPPTTENPAQSIAQPAQEPPQAPAGTQPPAAEAPVADGPTERQGGVDADEWANLTPSVQLAMYNTALDRIASLEQVCKERWARIEELEQGRAALTKTLTRAAEDLARPVLLLRYGGTARQAALQPGQPLLQVGDHYSEAVQVRGKRRINIWECTDVGEIDGRPVCTCRLIRNAAEAKGAA